MTRWPLLLALAGCARDPEHAAPVVLTDVVAWTLGDEPTALALDGDRVVALGDDALALVGPDTEVVSMDGAYVLPGLTDGHTHLLAGSFVFDKLLMVGVTGMPAILRATRAYATSHPDVPWIVGYGWLAPLTEDPSGIALDEVVPDRPAVLFDSSGHAVLVNSRAMALAGIDRDTPDPADGDGRIYRDDEGNPTGVLTEGAIQLVAPVVIDAFGDEALGANLVEQAQTFLDGGITSVSEILAVPGVDLGRPQVLSSVEASGRMPLRVSYYMPAFGLDDLGRVAEAREHHDGDLVRFVGVKIWVDGTTGSGEAWSLEPGVDHPDHYGLRYFDATQLADFFRAAEDDAFHVKLHVNGDAAVRAALDALEVVEAERGGLSQRYTFDHLVLISPPDHARMAALGVVASVQPTHHAVGGFSEQADLWSDGRFDRTWDFRSMIDAGVPVALGTDWPVWPSPAALATLSAATNTVGRRALSMEEALTGYTTAAATALGREDELGCLQTGCFADLVVLSGDPRQVAPSDLFDLRIEQVWVAGRRVR